MVSEEMSRNIVVGIPVFIIFWIAGGELLRALSLRYANLIATSATLGGSLVAAFVLWMIVSHYSGLIRIIILWGVAGMFCRWVVTIILVAKGIETGGTFIYIDVSAFPSSFNELV